MKRSISSVSGISVAVLVALGALSFLIWSQQPSRGVIVRENPEGVEVKGSSDTLETFTTSLFTTEITSNLKVKNKNEVPSPSILGQYLLTDRDSYVSDQLAITVGIVKENSVDEVSPVQFRRTFPDDYTETQPDPGFPTGSVMFIKQPEFEKSVFWVENGRYAGVVVSGGIQNQAQLENSLNAAVVNWRWL